MKSGGIRDDRLSDLLDRCGDCVLLRRVLDGEGNEMIKDCCSCIHEYRSPMSDICRECGIAMLNYEERKPQTNADRIRAMTDEELADFLGGIFTIETDIWGDYDPRLVVTQEPRVEIRDKEGMVDWLKAPVEEVDK